MTTAILTLGYPGSGKGTALEVASKHNIPTITMGNIVRTKAKRAYSITGNPDEFGSLDNDIVGPYATTMRELHGNDVMAHLTIDKIESSTLDGTDAVVIDGLRSVDELTVIEDTFDTVISVYIEASQVTRLERLHARGRDESEQELTRTALQERDEREESWGLAKVVEDEHYDVKLSNEGSLASFQREFSELLAKHAPSAEITQSSR